MKIDNLSELFSLKGISLTAALLLFAYTIGFLAGLFLEKFYGFRSKEIVFLGFEPKNALGITSAVASFLYFIWLLFRNSRKSD